MAHTPKKQTPGPSRKSPQISKKVGLTWRTHTPNLIKEIIKNPSTGILRIPLDIFRKTLVEVGERAAEINDPKLNALMCRLTIYSCADPEDPDYDPELTEKLIAAE